MHCDWKSRRAAIPVLRRLSIAATDIDTGDAVPSSCAEDVVVELPTDLTLLDCPVDDLDIAARDYIVARGVSPQQLRLMHIGVSYSGRYAYRVVFPVMVQGGLRGIVARDFTGTQEPKYLNSRGPKFLYGFDPEYETCVLSEGAIKSLRIRRAVSGCASAALLGHDLTDVQLDQLRDSHVRRVVLYPDPDVPGVRGIVSVAEKLVDTGLYVLVAPAVVPADEADAYYLERMVAIAEPYSDRTSMRAYRAACPPDWTAYMGRVSPENL